MKKPLPLDVLDHSRRASKLGDWLEARRRDTGRTLTPEERLTIALELSDACRLLRHACSKKVSTT